MRLCIQLADALQPFVRLVEKMGGLYTQHYVTRAGSRARVGGRRFELVYQGELAGVSNTRPVFAALVKGLVGPFSESGGRDVNIVNATLIAKEKGIVIDEVHTRGASAAGDGAVPYSSLVTLRSYDTTTTGSSVGEGGRGGEQIIEGYVSGRRDGMDERSGFDGRCRRLDGLQTQIGREHLGLCESNRSVVRSEESCSGSQDVRLDAASGASDGDAQRGTDPLALFARLLLGCSLCFTSLLGSL